MKGLNSVRHTGPSTIGIDTVYRSQGQIPELFLRGCGVPESFITYAKALTGSAIEYYSCFITTRPKTRTSPTASMPTFKPKASAVGLPRTLFKVVVKFTSRLMKLFASTTSSS